MKRAKKDEAKPTSPYVKIRHIDDHLYRAELFDPASYEYEFGWAARRSTARTLRGAERAGRAMLRKHFRLTGYARESWTLTMEGAQ